MADLLGPRWLGQLPPGAPAILCGDFNMSPRSVEYRTLAQRYQDVQTTGVLRKPLDTFASAAPFCRLDYIFVSGHFEVRSVVAPRNDITRIASDHLPLMAELARKAVSAGRDQGPPTA
jgi:endonuclease/exonuclease/phosphatase family metal-dependent hydrolase